MGVREEFICMTLVREQWPILQMIRPFCRSWEVLRSSGSTLKKGVAAAGWKLWVQATRLRGYAATRLRGYACCGFERRLYSHCRHLSFPYFPYLILVNRRFVLCSWCNCFRSSWFCFLVVRHCWKFPGLNSKEFLCSEELPIPHDITRVIPYFVWQFQWMDHVICFLCLHTLSCTACI